MQERRQYIRYDIEGDVLIKTEGDVLSSINGNLADISFGGLSIYIPEKIPEGSVVKFELLTKLSNKPVTGDGKILYVKEIKKYDRSVYRVGVEFMDIDKKSIQHILTYIQQDICLKARKKKIA